jgi:ribosomal protein S27AE
MKPKTCPRCQGRIFLEKDQYGWYELCLQCGYLHDLHDIRKMPVQLTDAEIERKAELVMTR